MNWQLTPYLFPLVFSGLLAGVIGFLAWKRRGQSSATTITILMSAVAIWSFAYAAQYSTVDIATWRFWANLKYIGIVSVPTAWLVYVIQTVGKAHWLTVRRLIWLSILPVLCLFSMWTDVSHHLFYETFYLTYNGASIAIHAAHGPLFWVNTVYSYVAIFLGTVILVYHFYRLPRLFKGQLAAAMLGALAPWIGNFLYVFKLTPWSELDLTPFMFTFTGLALLYGLLHYRMLELTPIARERLIEEMSDALVVLDHANRVVDLNPAFEQLTGMTLRQIAGQPIDHLLANWPAPVQCPESADSAECVLERPGKNGEPGKYYDLKITQLFARDGCLLGRLVLIHDITAQKAIEAENLKLYQAEHSQRLLAESLRRSGEVLNATLSMDAVLDRLLEQLEYLIPYDSANVGLMKDGKLHVTRTRGYERFGEDTARDIRNIVFDVQQTRNLLWMYENRQGQVIPDTHADPEWISTPATRYIRSFVGAPVVVRDQVIGFFSLDKIEANFYQQSHADLLWAFAGQAALAMENARLHEETIEHLRREQCLNQITQIMSEGTDLPAALRRVARLTCELAGADAGSLILLDNPEEPLYVPCLVNIQRTAPPPPPKPGEGLVWLIRQTGQSMRLDNYAEHPQARKYWRKHGVRSFLGVPILAGGERIGVIDLFLTGKQRSFSERDQKMVEAIANQTGVAVQNARLFKAAQRRAEEAEMLRAAAAAVSSALELDEVLNLILVNLEKVVYYDGAAIFLLEDGQLRVRAGRGFSQPERLSGENFSVENPLYRLVQKSERGLIIGNAQEDARFLKWGNAAHVRGWMGVPLQSRGQPIGLLTLDSVRADAFDDNDAALTKAFADEAASAIENARLFAEVQRLATTDPLTGLLNRRQFFKLAQIEFERSQRYASPLTLVMMDMDNLKQINDRYGHQAGDQMIQLVARRCQSVLRGVDLIGRYAGDEFILLLPETRLEGALGAAQRLCDEISHALLETGEHCISTSVSAGAAELQADCGSLKVLLEQADRALYQAKRAGKNQVFAWRADIFQDVFGAKL